MVKIRAPREAELAALSDLCIRSKAYWGYDAAFMAACREELTLSPADLATSRIGVGEVEGDIVAGVCQVTPLDGNGDLSIFVDPDWIGHGVGRALYAWALEQTRDMGAARLIIDADPNALNFYLRMGAVVIGEHPSTSIPGRMLTRLVAEV